MVRGRKPKPTALKEASGSLRKDPQRRNTLEPKPSKSRPAMPKSIGGDPVAKLAWNSLCDQLAEMNVLTAADVFVVEKLAMMESFLDYSWKDKDAALFNRLLATWKGLLIECGLTPSSRARTKMTVPDEEEDPANELLERMK